MSTSGSVNFNNTRNEIILAAYQMIGYVGYEESSVSSTAQTAAEGFLNRMIKDWQLDGIHLWKRAQCTLFLQADQVKYILGATDHCSETVVETTLGAAEASGQTVLTITSTTGMTASDNIGIVLDSGSIHWTTISSVDSSTQVTVAVATTGAAASGNFVYTYTTRISRPHKILHVLRKMSDNTEIELTELSRTDYLRLSQKTNEGDPTSYYVDDQLTVKHLYTWQEPNDMRTRLKIDILKSIEDFDTAVDNPDFPQEYLDAIIVNLAVKLAPGAGMTDEGLKLAPAALTAKKRIRNYENTDTPVEFKVDMN